MDYIESRNDIAGEKFCSFGMSWGTMIGTIVSAVDDRIKTNIFVSGGLDVYGRPEVGQAGFMSRVTAPTLMVNGRFDSVFPLDQQIEPLYDNLGTSAELNRLALFDSDHIPPRDSMIAETLVWLDEYLGIVESEVNLATD